MTTSVNLSSDVGPEVNVRAAPPASWMMAGLAVILGDLVAGAAVVAMSGLRPAGSLVVVAGTMALFGVLGHYRVRISPSMSRKVGTVVAVICSVILVRSALERVAIDRHTYLTVVVYAGAIVVLRMVTHALIRQLRSRRLIIEPVLILGAGSLGCEMARALLDHPEYGLEPIGFVGSSDEIGLPVPVLGDVSQLDRLLAYRGIRHIIVAFGATGDMDLVSAVRTCERRRVEIYVVPRFFELGVPIDGRHIENIWGIPLQHLQRSFLKGYAQPSKRYFDVAVTVLALPFAAPLFGLLALLVRLSGSGPIFFRQRRIGQHGRPIEVLKFRSMRPNDDSNTTWSVSDDERVTSIGRLMRRTSLDELPQLINVLKGDMSLVGPRPERPFFVARFAEEIPRYRDRHRMPVGITGWAQIHGLRGDTPISQRTRFDNQYIENWSLWLDIAILSRTLSAIVFEAVLTTRHGRGTRRHQAAASAAQPPSVIGLTMIPLAGHPVDAVLNAANAAVLGRPSTK